MKKIALIAFISIFFSNLLNAVNTIPGKKQLHATRITTPPKINGKLDESIWKTLPLATGFIQHAPYAGKPCSFHTEVRMGYDNTALYIGAMMEDPSPDSILTGLGKRDDWDVNSDIFAITVDPFNDGLSAFEFWVSASGVQIDKFLSNSGGGFKWDAVWESATQVTDKGWTAEIRIPFSAIRFPKKDVQTWGIILWRNIRRYDEWATWDLIDPQVHGMLKQSQKYAPVTNVEPPTRLSFTPYVSGYAENYSYSDSWDHSFNGGMDIKYGINESFTLDMTLIPDFGQVQSDDKVLNLSPYEVKYDEKRQFFTEGVELFNKGGVFYSRRIGDRPAHSGKVDDDLEKNEVVAMNPIEAKLINASKISGRNKNGLGIGLFNAMTDVSTATIKDTITGEKRYIETQPFTNYNIFVLDQNLKNNSFLSFVNTNVTRFKDNYSANVTGTEYSFINPGNTYSIRGNLLVSQKYTNTKPELGHKYYVQLSKIFGNFRYSLMQNTESDQYDPNDLGFLRQNNEFTNRVSLHYNKYKPFWEVLNWYNEIRFEHKSLYAPRKFSEFAIDFTTKTKLRNNYWLGSHSKLVPVERHDFYESRVDGRVFNKPKFHHVCAWFDPESTKTFGIAIRGGYSKSYHTDHDFFDYWYNIGPKWRVNDKLSLNYDYMHQHNLGNIGWVDYTSDKDTIYFGKRDRQVLINTFQTNYIFTNKSSFSLRLRHYFTIADYKKFYELEENGDLSDTDYNENNDRNYNLLNLDMQYTWNFAPGSEMRIVWKNEIFSDENIIRSGYIDNLDHTLSVEKMNSLSIKILYYLDYLYLKKLI